MHRPDAVTDRAVPEPPGVQCVAVGIARGRSVELNGDAGKSSVWAIRVGEGCAIGRRRLTLEHLGPLAKTADSVPPVQAGRSHENGRDFPFLPGLQVKRPVDTMKPIGRGVPRVG